MGKSKSVPLRSSLNRCAGGAIQKAQPAVTTYPWRRSTSWFAPPPPSLRKAHERGGRGVARSDQTSVVVPANLEHVFWFFWIAIRLRVAECERQSNISNLG